MTGYQPSILAEWAGARLIPGSVAASIQYLLHDSRKLVFPAHTAFFALHRSRRDGHQYIPELYQRGVRCFVVEQEPEVEQMPEASFLVVGDSLKAMQDIAARHRRQFHYPVVGITGSNGKTIVKEWAWHLLSPDLRIVRSPRSYNSQVGVPLSAWQMQEQADLAILEAGISQTGEMAALERIIAPDIGIFTHIGDAHAEGFRDIREKLAEKMLLFRHSRTLICCADHPDILSEARAAQVPGQVIFAWGRATDNPLQLRDYQLENGGSRLRCRYREQEFSYWIPFADQASRVNAMHCCALMLVLNVPVDTIVARMPGLPVLSMRLELKEGINRTLVINDSYSADLDSLQLALDFLVQQQQHERRTVILSDIVQSGKTAAALYRQVAELLKQKHIQRLVGIGSAISEQSAIFRDGGMETTFHASTADFLDAYHPSQFRDETILLKGSRQFEFERIAGLLEKKVHQTVLDINLASVAQNLRHYQQGLRPQTRLMAMVKAFSYGTGAYEIASLLQFHRVDYLAVAYADEGVELRKAGIRLPIMVMNAEAGSFPLLTAYDLQPELYSMEMTKALETYLQGEGLMDFPVHLKLDTGMHRLGFSPAEVPELAGWLSRSGVFRVQSVFSHLVASEDPSEDAFTRSQGSLFLEACRILEAGLGYSFIRHIANTAAIRRHPDLQLDMVRLGIGLYGVDPGLPGDAGLVEAITLKTTIAQVRPVPAGETVGYNRKGRLTRDSLVATIRIGYADGYPRSLGNGAGKVLIQGRLFPVIGNVCMDMTMVDVTDFPQVSAGDDVILFGPELSVAQVARWAGTIPYEMLTGISQRVKRVYFEA